MSRENQSLPISEEHLSRISTHWSKLANAKDGKGPDAREAQTAILSRYWRAVVRYLYSILRDADAVEECSQEFALRFVRGDFRNVDYQKGRFRDFLRTSLMNLSRDYLRQRNRQPRQDLGGQLAHASLLDPAPDFDAAWRQEIINNVWENLRLADVSTAGSYYEVLKMKSAAPGLRSADLALEVSEKLGRTITPEACRQMVHRAREKFASLLFDEVRRSLNATDDSDVRTELAELGLTKYWQVGETST